MAGYCAAQIVDVESEGLGEGGREVLGEGGWVHYASGCCKCDE